jgi:hypothetical protein
MDYKPFFELSETIVLLEYIRLKSRKASLDATVCSVSAFLLLSATSLALAPARCVEHFQITEML